MLAAIGNGESIAGVRLSGAVFRYAEDRQGGAGVRLPVIPSPRSKAA
jgi:hypothetical protein